MDEKLIEIFQKVFRDPGLLLSRETTAKDVKYWDSLNHITLIYEIETAFKIRFTMRELTEIRSFGGLQDAIASKVTKS